MPVNPNAKNPRAILLAVKALQDVPRGLSAYYVANETGIKYNRVSEIMRRLEREGFLIAETKEKTIYGKERRVFKLSERGAATLEEKVN